MSDAIDRADHAARFRRKPGAPPRPAGPRPVSLSGKTRLSYREAVALLTIVQHGAYFAKSCDDPGYYPRVKAAKRALDKLLDAIRRAGGYDAEGRLIDPFAGRDENPGDAGTSEDATR